MIDSVADVDLEHVLGGPFGPEKVAYGFRGLWIATDNLGRFRAFPSELEALRWVQESPKKGAVVHYQWGVDLPFTVWRP
jgi:hypothetical protein